MSAEIPFKRYDNGDPNPAWHEDRAAHHLNGVEADPDRHAELRLALAQAHATLALSLRHKIGAGS